MIGPIGAIHKPDASKRAARSVAGENGLHPSGRTTPAIAPLRFVPPTNCRRFMRPEGPAHPLPVVSTTGSRWELSAQA